MLCPHCQKDNPDYATVCVWCGQHMIGSSEEGRAEQKTFTKRKYGYIAAAVALLLAAVVLCAVLFRPQNKTKLIGTWALDVSVSELITAAMGDETDGTMLSALMAAVAERDMTVTVYCRFYEDDTYSVYVQSEDLTAALEQLTRSAVTVLCEDGLYEILEKQGLSRSSVDGLLNLMGISSQTLSDTVYDTVSDWMKPLYDRLSAQLRQPSGDTGERYYELDDDRLYLSLEEGKRVEEGVYVVLSFDGEHIRALTDTQLDRYLTGLVWSRVTA